jgi:hypothetical protein
MYSAFIIISSGVKLGLFRLAIFAAFSAVTLLGEIITAFPSGTIKKCEKKRKD